LKIKGTYKKILQEFGLGNYLKVMLYLKYFRLKLRFLDLSKSQTIKVNGYDFCTVPNDKGISAELLMFGTHEPISTQLLSQELKKGMVCLDVGANIGYYACLEANAVGEEGRVIAIEPSTQNFKTLKRNAELQKKSNIKVYNFACGDVESQVSFLTSDRSNWSKILDKDTIFEYDDKIIKQDTVIQKTIDFFLDEIRMEQLDLIRMDTEGYESKIIPGMRKTIKKFKPMIHFELHKAVIGEKGTRDILEYLQREGYGVEHYLPRILDVPVVGKIEFARKVSINQLLEKLQNNTFPGTILLLLKNFNK